MITAGEVLQADIKIGSNIPSAFSTMLEHRCETYVLQRTQLSLAQLQVVDGLSSNAQHLRNITCRPFANGTESSKVLLDEIKLSLLNCRQICHNYLFEYFLTY